MSSSSLYNSISSNIKRFGSQITLVTFTDTGMDLDHGEAIQQRKETALLGIIGKYSSSEIIEGVIDINDTKITLQSQIRVKKGDQILFDGNTYEVRSVRSLTVKGMILKYTLQVRS